MLKKQCSTLLTTLSLSLGIEVTHVHGQVVYSTLGASLIETFDTLQTNTMATDWVDNGTLPGWYAAYESNETVIIDGSHGDSSFGRLYSYGLSEDNERAFGSLASGATRTITRGVRLINDTGFTLTQFTTVYDGEQWRLGRDNDSVNSLTMDFQIFSPGGGSITAEGYTSLSSATFDGPQVNTDPGSPSALNGNDGDNRIADITSTVASIHWAPNDELWIRFRDPNDDGFDHGLAVDNFRFTAIPEPSAYVALFGLVVLGATALLKPRRKA